MKIITKKVIESVSEINIPLPYFCKYENYVFKVVSEETVLYCYNYGTSSLIKACDFWLAKSDIEKSEPCKEEEFNAAYSKALGVIDKVFMMPEPTLFDGQEEEIAQTN